MTDDIDRIGPGKRTEADKLLVAISTSSGHQGRVSNKSMTWPRLCEKMGTTVTDNITMKEYRALSAAEQHKKKNVGYFIGGQFDEGRRLLGNIHERTLLTLDIDRCSPEMLKELLNPVNLILKDFEYYLYSTRNHTPEAPRVRVVIPLSSPIAVEKLAPLTRILSHFIDNTMDTVDPVSFRPNQLMYWASTCKDAEFVNHRHRGRLFEAAPMLAGWGDWTDYSKLPRSAREDALRKSAGKAPDPRLKRGIIGAFCRCYDIPAVIETFLPTIYAPGDAGRYTYLPGSTTNGAVLYDDSMYLYSNHGTDPCADKLVNPYDLGRIHLFGHLDKASDRFDADGDVTKLPSYAAMMERIKLDPLVIAEMTRNLYDMEAIADDFETDDDEEENAPALTREPTPARAEATSVRNWMDDLDCTSEGYVKSTLHNVILILENDKRFVGALAYNEFLQEPVLVRRIRAKQYGHDTGPIKHPQNGDYITDVTLSIIRVVLEGPRGEGRSGWGLKVSERDLASAVSKITDKNRFHPVQNYIRGCAWDGVPRVRRMWTTYWHAAPSLYHEEVAFLFMVAAVARIFEPGHKFDFVPILEGLQGIMKSSSAAMLAGAEWFAELTADLENTAKVVENINGKWVVEIPDLASFDRTESTTLKALFSAETDRTRLAWGRGAKDYPRQNVFIGTTNELEYFRDLTGNRRYWPIRLPGQPIDMEGLGRDRDLLWAEAYQAYQWMRRVHPNRAKPLPLYLQGTAKAAAEALQSERMVTTSEDSLTGQILEWLETPVPAAFAKAGYRPSAADDMDDHDDGSKLLRSMTCVRDVIHYCLGLDERNFRDQRLSRQVAAAISAAPGWIRAGKLRLGFPLGQQKIWTRVDDGEL